MGGSTVNQIKWLCIALLIITTTACGKPKWEYMVKHCTADQDQKRTGKDAGKWQSVTPDKDELSKFGAEGWELVSTYLEMETAWTNFGNEDYVTGLQPNVRPQRVVFLFKRRL